MLTIRENGDRRLVLYEHGEPEFEQAWQVLIETGHEPYGWIYMDTMEIPGLRLHGFEHIDSRRYVRFVEITDAGLLMNQATNCGAAKG